MKYKLSFLSALIGLSIIPTTTRAMDGYSIITVEDNDFAMSLDGKRRSKDESTILGVLQGMYNLLVDDVNRFDCRICLLPDVEGSQSPFKAVACVGDDNYYVGISKLPVDSKYTQLLVATRPDIPFFGSEECKRYNDYRFTVLYQMFHRYINR